MSGGSWDYLCHKDSREILGRQSSLEKMANRLAEEGYGLEANATRELLRLCRLFENKAEFIIERISPVWQAIEWWDSGDSGPEEVKQASEKFREIK